MTFDVTRTADALAARDKATDELRKLALAAVGRKMTTAEQARERSLIAAITEHDEAVKGLIASGVPAAEYERKLNDWHATQRATGMFMGNGHHLENERRDLRDAKLFGVSLRAIDGGEYETDEIAPITLAAAAQGSKLLGKVNVFPAKGSRGLVPVAPRVTARIIAPAGALPDELVSATVDPFRVIKVTAATTVDMDDLQDYPFMDAATSAALASAVGQRIDHVLTSGGTDGVDSVPGFTQAGETNSASAAGGIGLIDVRNAVARIEDNGGTANALIMSPMGKAAFLAEYADRIGLLPEIVTIGKLGDGTAALNDFSFVAADLTTVGVAMRKEIELRWGHGEPDLYPVDKAGLMASARIGGVSLANRGTVQVVTGTAA